ncbi:MAG TPA: tRNA pseudouridine(38-40) synthase TruA [Myxococcaceae bacterium]|nr:tRNA pseudouridine(38-40) synthase TruA [Myxococcaceae bacterium]
MPRLKLTLEYDGTDYVGWQVQPNGRSLQAVMERALETLLQEQVAITAAGRTDAGVHALGQVVSFRTDKTLPLQAYLRGMGSILPPDVAVVAAEEVPDAFDPRRWSLGKRYRYLISNRPVRSPLKRRTHWEIFPPLDVPQMTEAARYLIGRHDFSAFRASDCTAAHAVRELTRLDIAGQAGADVTVTVEGTAFVKHMVRNMVGALVEVGRGRQAVAWVREVLESRDRTRAGPTAPAHGLTLVEVRYGEGPRLVAPPDDHKEDA